MEKQQQEQEIKDIIANREEGYGFQLKAARNEQNLTTADVARELRLDEKIIIAMESEDQAKLPVSAFVCGYIRNYARFLNVQPEPLVEYYKREYQSNCSDPELKITKGKDIKGHSDSPGFMMPLLMVLGLATLVAGAWYLWLYISSEFLNKESGSNPELIIEQTIDNQIDNEAPDQLSLPEPDKNSYPPLDNISEPATNSQGAKKQGSNEQGVVEPENSQTIANTATANTAMGSESASDLAGSTNTDTRAENNSLTTNSETIEPNTKHTTATVTQVVSVGENPQSVIQARESSPVESSLPVQGLHLTFHGDSWIVIKDSTGKKLASGLKRSGKTLDLEGKPPYDVFLGNGRVVDVRINGKKYDHSRYINDKNIARFSVE